MGAFRSYSSLEEALKFELERPATDEVAATDCRLLKTRRGLILISGIKHAKVGLVVTHTAIRRRWSGDVWSEWHHEKGRLVRTSKPRGKWTEVWCAPIYSAIVVVGKISYDNWMAVQEISATYGKEVIRVRGY